jgi:uncharacterized protein (DUF1697 family)
MWVALLRGVNVGGRNKLPMAELRAVLADAGYEAVATYIQSGNIVFGSEARHDQAACDRVASQLRGIVAERFELDVPIVAFPAERLHEILAANPYPELETEPKHLHVFFTQEPVPATAFAELDAERFAPDSVTVVDGVIYASYPAGMARSKLTNAVLDRTVGAPTTARNWATVRKLADLTSDSGPADN